VLASAICREACILGHLGESTIDCSFIGDADQQELTPEAEIVNVRFTKSVIASKESFTYEAAQLRKDDK
jgi:hypothetical protein